MDPKPAEPTKLSTDSGTLPSVGFWRPKGRGSQPSANTMIKPPTTKPGTKPTSKSALDPATTDSSPSSS
ncbi:hypothetical protein CERSUDRAFT_99902 [Gelatoporia subvermispora B]|uniref:Uncharacterized protein n=1 Tax=Ceriporiopsis subvermispora (strain B) TaxID=914234 RepID=M2R111_CERS8|nr:hypothetical protein CERSUDRAFT_99902 [Gelatoporia subvermispora B]